MVNKKAVADKAHEIYLIWQALLREGFGIEHPAMAMEEALDNVRESMQVYAASELSKLLGIEDMLNPGDD